MPHGAPRSCRRARSSAPCDAARQWSRADLLRRRRLCALSRPARRTLPSGGGRGVGLVPDAEPRAPDPRAVRPGRLAPRARAGASRLCRHHPGAAQTQRSFLAGAVRRRRDGRKQHLAAALRYVSLNPVRARLVERAQDWRWSSMRAHLRNKDDGVTALKPVSDRFPRFADLLASEGEPDLFARLRAAESVGPAARRRSLSRSPRATDPAFPQTGQAWAEAVRTGKPSMSAAVANVN